MTHCHLGNRERLPCGDCDCDMSDVATAPPPSCGTEGYVPCWSCKPSCVYYERSTQIHTAQETGAWWDGISYDAEDMGWVDEPEPLDPAHVCHAMVKADTGTLNDAQQAVVNHRGGPCLVVAGAGSGKTRSVVARIVAMLEEGIEGSEILALTFTRKAAQEMRGRVSARVGERQARDVTLSTFHSLAMKICRDAPSLVGREHGFSIWDDVTTGRQLRTIARETAEANNRSEAVGAAKASEIYEKLGLWKATGADLHGDLFTDAFIVLHPDALEVVKAYESLKASTNALDFDDLIYRVVRMLSMHDEVRDRYRACWRYLIVDEYQDTNGLQERMIGLLMGPEANLMAVGDEDQSIYGWRGAEVEHILTFTDRYAGAVVYYLGQNYRSIPEIVDAAAAVIGHNTQRRDKRIWSEHASGSPIAYPLARTSHTEAALVGEQIANSLDGGEPPEEHAILVRTRRQIYAVQMALQLREIPHVIVGGVSWWQRTDAKLVLAWMRVLLNPMDLDAACYVFSHHPRIGVKTIAIYRALANIGGDPAHEYVLRLQSHKGCGEHTKKGQAIAAFHQIWMEAQHKFRGGLRTLVQLIEWFYERTGLNADIKDQRGSILPKDSSEAISRSELRISFLHFAGEVDQHANVMQQAQAFIDLIYASAEEQRQGAKVVISTLHGSKGLEWDAVWMVGCVEGLLPFLRGDPSHEDDNHIEEERRLAYVGMTRARYRLTMSRSDVIDGPRGEPTRVKPSRFLVEAGGVRAGQQCETAEGVVIRAGERRKTPPNRNPARVSTGRITL